MYLNVGLNIFLTKPNLKPNVPQLQSTVQSPYSGNEINICNIMYYELYKLIKQPTLLSKDELRSLKEHEIDPEVIPIQTDKFAILNTDDYKNKMIECNNNM